MRRRFMLFVAVGAAATAFGGSSAAPAVAADHAVTRAGTVIIAASTNDGASGPVRSCSSPNATVPCR
jgi:hypothetical protein